MIESLGYFIWLSEVLFSVHLEESTLKIEMFLNVP